MSTQLIDPEIHARTKREVALAIGARRKAARRRRTGRLRRSVAALAFAAFVGPFSVIYTQMAAGHDPALATTSKVAPALGQNVVAGESATSSAAQAREAALERARKRAAKTAARLRAQRAAAPTVTPAPVQTQQS
ncbi:MAG TPA: hypothetical protein VF066_16120 [Thermoleophilaceae bacterium]